jgi:hypothetical protein
MLTPKSQLLQRVALNVSLLIHIFFQQLKTFPQKHHNFQMPSMKYPETYFNPREASGHASLKHWGQRKMRGDTIQPITHQAEICPVQRGHWPVNLC